MRFIAIKNTRYENIKFTFEKEKDNKLLFLDIIRFSQKDMYCVTAEL